MIIINVFSSPKVSRKNAIDYVFNTLKQKEINCKIISEYENDDSYESYNDIKNRIRERNEYIKLIEHKNDKVDCIITDNPVLLSIDYRDNLLPFDESINDERYKIFNSLKILNYFIYHTGERLQNESFKDIQNIIEISEYIKKMMDDNHIPYSSIPPITSGYNYIVNDVLSILNKK